MSDLVQRLREYSNWGISRKAAATMSEAADELERLTRELEEARKDAARHRAAITWALGTNGEFKAQGTMDGRYWWRGELAERAGLTWNSERWVDRQGAAMSQEK